MSNQILLSSAALLAFIGPYQAQAQTAAAAPVQTAAADETPVSEIVVTGTSIRGIAPVGSPVTGFTLQDIQRTAPRTTADLLATLPQVAQFNRTPTGASTFGAIVAATSLRPNIGDGATLVLVNGHRLITSGINTAIPDVSDIPTSAIARVEVIADGASAIYGSDAVGGVINFITRQKFEGADTTIRYSDADSYNGFSIGQVIGLKWSSGSAVVSGEYTGNSELSGSKRSYYTNLGTTAGLSNACSTATFGPSPILCDTAKLQDLQPRKRRGAIFATVRQDVTETIEMWGDALYSQENRHSIDLQPNFPASTMAAGNPFNPTGTSRTLFYRPTTEFGPGLARDVKMEVFQASLGAVANLPHDFAANVFGTYGQSINTAIGAGTDNLAYIQALAGTTAATAFDPFGHTTSSTVLAKILDGTEFVKSTQRLTEFGAKLDGPVFTLPGGEVRIAVGAGWRRQEQVGFRRVGSPNSVLVAGTGYLSRGDGDASRAIPTVYGEVFVPIVGSDNSIPLIHSLSLSAAVRYDHYSDFGGTTNPKIGFDWHLTDSLRVFGNHSTSFQAPSLADTQAGAVDTRIQLSSAAAPVFAPSGNAILNQYTAQPGLVIAGGSPSLKPQTADNLAFGFEFAPKRWSGFKASATYYDINFKNFINIPFTGAGSTFSNPAFAQYGILAPIVNGAIQPFTAGSPQVTQFTNILPVDGGLLPTNIYWIAVLQRVNVATKIQNGIDYDVSKQFDLGNSSSVTARVSGTVILHDKLQGSPGAAFTNVLPTDSASRISGALDYQGKQLAVGATVNYLSGFFTSVAQTSHVSSFTLVNLRGSYEFGGTGELGGMQLSLNIDNLFDKAPPFQVNAAGGIAFNNVIGRMFTVGLRKHF